MNLDERLAYLSTRRWFVRGDGPVVDVEHLPWSREPDDGFGVRVELVTVATPAGGRRTYHVPASYRREPFPGLESARMAAEDGWHVYDALLDAHARSALLAGFGDTIAIDPLTPTVPLVAEQSNTSIVVGDRLLWKAFRIVGPGHNPDIEIGRALTATGSTAVAPVRGWIRVGDIDLAMIYDYYPSATDGWDSARASFRDLLAEPDLTAAEAGADFAAEARRLGATVATVHRLMESLGTTTRPVGDMTARLRVRFDDAVAACPELEAWRDDVLRAYAELDALGGEVEVQRVHGDLHLGQTLRTVDGWRIFDFEGEPAAPLADRRLPDSPLRDVAGMLRSFDYAPRSVLMQTGDHDDAVEQAAQWTARNSEAFLASYGIEPGTRAYVILRCQQIDKAAYEVTYEARHRPGWTTIPRDALTRLLG